MKKFILLLITTLILGGLFAAPLNESFSDPTFPPSGWTVHNVDGGQAWIRNTSSTHYYSAPAVRILSTIPPARIMTGW